MRPARELRYPCAPEKTQLERGRSVEATLYHVVLEGRRLGPYDRRTIVGMRIRNTLSSEQVLEAPDGARLTVADVVNIRPRDSAFQPNRSGSFSLVQARYPASLLYVRGPGTAIPDFRDEIEVRVQTDVLRIAGRFRKALAWVEDRVKLPLHDIVHARVRGTVVDLWIRHDGTRALQRIGLELFTPDAAGEFVEYLPAAQPWPAPDSQIAALSGSAARRGVWPWRG